MVRTGRNRPFVSLGITGELPVTISTVIVSPTTRPMPSMIAAMIPDRAAGTVTVTIVCQRVAPRAHEPIR